MKTIKRISALLLVLMLMASFSITAFAEDIGPIDVSTSGISSNSVDKPDSDVISADTGVNANATGLSSNNIVIHDIDAEGTGINAHAQQIGEVNITANNVDAEETGINAYAQNMGEVNITANNVDAGGTGINAKADSQGKVNITANDVDAEGTGINAEAYLNGETNITADNVYAGDTAISVHVQFTSKATITVGAVDENGSLEDGTGTVIGGIKFSESVTGKNTQITLWKVDKGDITVNGATASDDIVKAVLNYYVRKEDPQEGGSLEVDNSNTVKFGDTVSVNVTPKAGYKVDKVLFNDTETAVLDNGKYSFQAPRLGGIMVKAVFSLDKPDTPSVNPAPAPAVATTCKLTFDLGGGTIDGKSEYSKTYSYGQHIKLPIPEKEGYTFGGWETTVRGKTVTYEGGARYTVTAAKTFTAIWIEN